MTQPAHISDEQGFSLIEALVALAVLAIASVGLIRAVESHMDSTRALERRAAAMWVAENRLAELELSAAAQLDKQVEMLNQIWEVDVVRTGTTDPAINRVQIRVTAQGERSPLATLDGFVKGLTS